MFSINLFLFLQSNAIALIPASSNTSVFFPQHDQVPHLFRSGHAINTRSSVDIFLNVLPRILLALSRLDPNQARFLVLNLQFHQLFSSAPSFQIVHEVSSESSPSILEHGSQKLRVQYSTEIWIRSIALTKLPVLFSKVALQVNRNTLYLPHVFTRFRSHQRIS